MRKRFADLTALLSYPLRWLLVASLIDVADTFIGEISALTEREPSRCPRPAP